MFIKDMYKNIIFQYNYPFPKTQVSKCTIHLTINLVTFPIKCVNIYKMCQYFLIFFNPTSSKWGAITSADMLDVCIMHYDKK